MKKTTLLPLIAIMSFSSMGVGSAALIAYDQFTGYSDGNLNGQGQGFGWGGNWGTSNQHQVNNAGGLTQSALTGVVAGGGVNTGSSLADGNITISRSLTTPLASTGTYFISFLMQGMSGAHHETISLVGSNGNQARAGTWNTATHWRLIRKDNSNWGDTSTGVTRTTATTHFVLKLVLGATDTASLFINPADATALAGSANQTYDYAGNWGTISSISMYRSNQGTSTGNFNFDEVRVGTAAADIFSAIPVPEPSSATLLSLLGSLALLRRKRSQ